MRKSILFSLLIICFSIQTKAQCPIASFSVADTACGGNALTIINNSSFSGPINYTWDFNTGDLLNTPNGHLNANFPSLSSCRGIELAEDNGNYFAVSVISTGEVFIMNFGNSPDNTPTVTSLGMFGILAEAYDLALIKDHGEWYAFISQLSGNNICMLAFGSSLTNTPVASVINAPGVSGPVGLTAVNDQGNAILLVANYFANSITVVNFGASFQNPGYTSSSVPVGLNPFGITVLHQCNNWYGYVGYLSGTDVSVIDFGSNLTGTPVNYSGSAYQLAYPSRKATSLTDGENNFVFFTSLNKNALTRINLGTNPFNPTPVVDDLGSFSIYTDHLAYSIKKFGSSIKAIAVNYDTGDLINFIFPETNGFTVATSTDSLPNVSLPSPGLFHISLTAEDTITGLSSVYTDSVFIKPSPSPDFVTGIHCEGDLVSFNDTSTINNPAIISQQWDFGDFTTANGDSVTHTFIGNGSFNVTLTSTNAIGCSVSTTHPVTINAIPVVGFTFLDQQCAGTNLMFTDTSSVHNGSIQSWHWDFGNGDTSDLSLPSYAYINGGTYNVKLVIISSAGCTDSVSQNANVLFSPITSFSIANTCINELTQFTNNTQFGGTGTLNFTWDFGDANTSNQISPSHNYPATPGNYIVSLISQALNGCADTLTENIRIGNQPVPYFKISLDTACAGNAITITDSSYFTSGDSIVHHYWDFGDNTYDSTSVNPVHSYSNPGNYLIKLTVVSPTSCDSSVSRNIFVIQSPVAAFSSTGECIGTGIPFQDLSTSPSGSSIVSWTWSFGDNDSTHIENPTHNYATAGFFTVSLQVTSSKGCFNTLQQQVQVYDKPKVKFGIGKACTLNPIQFADSSTVTAGTISSWSWNFGVTGAISNLQNPTYTYSNALAYPVTLVATSSFGCTDSATRYTIISPSPQFNIVATGNCIYDSTRFVCNMTVGNPANMGYLWDFGNLNSSLLQNPSFYFNTPGIYPVSLTVESLTNTCFLTKTDTITISPLPVASFLTDSACINTDLQLHDLSSVATGSIQSWNWTLGSYGLSGQQNPVLNIPTTDTIPVKLVVTTDAGCMDSVSHPIYINGKPTVNFIPSPYFGAPPLAVNFINVSSAGNYQWVFGDNSAISNNDSPIHVYQDTGTFNVTLITTTLQGCSDSAKNSILVLIPLLDLGIEGINFTKQGDLWQLSAKVRNNGNQVITQFTLNAQLAGKSVINELFDTDSILPGDFKNITFHTRFNVTNNDNPGYLCIDIEEVNFQTDDNLSNNHKCITADKSFQVYDLYPNPFKEQFNIGLSIPEEGLVVIRLFNLQGQLIQEPVSQQYLQGYNTTTISSRYFESGVYLMEIEYADIKKIFRLEKY